MDQRPNVRAKTIKLLEENVGKNLYDHVLSNSSLDVTPKAIKNKIDKFVIKIKKLCAPKDHQENKKTA